MKVLSKEEATLWCRAHGVALHRNLPDHSGAEFKFKIPSDAQARVRLVDQGMKFFGNEHQVLVWFSDWAVWPSGQRMHVFDRFRLSYGITQRLIDSPGHLFDATEIEDAVSFVTLAVLFLWDCHIVVPDQRKQLYFSHDEFGLSKGAELPGSERVPPFDGVRPYVLPVWSAYDRTPPPDDPIGCPVSVEEIVEYLRPMLPFSVDPANLEFIATGRLDPSFYWLWGIYGDDGRRWNICVFWQPEPLEGRTRTWMCADNNPRDLNDHQYVIAIHNNEY